MIKFINIVKKKMKKKKKILQLNTSSFEKIIYLYKTILILLLNSLY